MISACKGGSANKVTGLFLSSVNGYPDISSPRPAVLPYFPYSRQSKKKSHRGAITARMLANLLGVAGVKHVITVDLHASQMQGFFRCPVDNLHAEPIIAKWVRRNVSNWREAVVVSKNAGGTKRVTSLADALKLNFGLVTTDRKRGANMTNSMVISHLDGADRRPVLEKSTWKCNQNYQDDQDIIAKPEAIPAKISKATANLHGFLSTVEPSANPVNQCSPSPSCNDTTASTLYCSQPLTQIETDYDDRRAQEVIHGRLVQGHIVEDDFPSSSQSTTENSLHEEDPMVMSHASSFFAPERQSLAGGGDPEGSSDEEDNAFQNPMAEHMITLVGDVKNRTVFIVDDMIDKPGSWIAAAETVVKKGRAKKVYCIATHGVFGADCLEQLQACECIDTIVVTNSFPINETRARNTGKLVILDLSSLLAEAIRRNHYGESISPLFQHTGD